MIKPENAIISSYIGDGSPSPRSHTFGFKPTLLQIINDAGDDFVFKSSSMLDDSYQVLNKGATTGLTFTSTGFRIASSNPALNTLGQTYYVYAHKEE